MSDPGCRRHPLCGVPTCDICPKVPSADPKPAHTCLGDRSDLTCVACYPSSMPPAPFRPSLPADSAARKEIPLARGLLDYFPAALAAVASVSKKGNDQHNPGQPMHHARGKSMDHADCILRHLVDRGTVDTDGVRHAAKVAWRALALLQEELEQCEGAPLPRGAKQ